MLGVLLTTVLAAGGSNPVLAKVEAKYKQPGDLSLSFSQTRVEKLRGKKYTESGKLWAKKDGRVRWTYYKPVRKDFVFNGTTAYMYEPENAQVTIFDDFRNSQLLASMEFLWGQGDVREMFEVKSCTRHCDTARAHETPLELVPKRPLASASYIIAIFDKAKHTVNGAVSFDSLGNRNEYVFTDIAFGSNIPDKKFDFQIPAGVQIMHSDAAKRSE